MEKSYLEFVEKVKGKNINEVEEILSKINIFKEDISALDEFLIVGEVVRRINLCDKKDPIQFSFLKRTIIYFAVLENYTTFDISSEEMSTENFILSLEITFKKNILINHFYTVVEDTLKYQEMNVIAELVNLLQNIPSVQELDNIQQKFKDMFDETSENKLKIIDSILAYNDPTMQTIKDALLDNNYMSATNQNQLKEVADKTLNIINGEIDKNGDEDGDSSK